MTENQTAIFITHPSCLEHDTGKGHPESPARLHAILPVLEKLLPKIEAQKATVQDLLMVHTSHHIKNIQNNIPNRNDNIYFLDPDTSVSLSSEEASFRSAGAAMQAIDLLLDNKAKFVFNAVRPPGHHASAEKPCGFCLFNNVALAAKYALQNKAIKRIAIIDPDVHHGNGTQDIMWDEPDCLFISTHQYPLFPYTGTPDECGAYNNILNIPLASGSNGAEMRGIYKKKVFPRIKAFAPDLLLISAGFDAHKNDPLASLEWETNDYAWLGEHLKELADELCQGRIMATLEGGYNLDALAASIMAFVKPFTK